MLPEKPENAVPVIFELPICHHVWYLHIESQVNKIADVPSPPFTIDPGLYFVRQKRQTAVDAVGPRTRSKLGQKQSE